jgi:hypothetical protein
MSFGCYQVNATLRKEPRAYRCNRFVIAATRAVRSCSARSR